MRKAFEWRKNIELVDFVAEDRDIDPVERVSTVEKLEIKKNIQLDGSKRIRT